MSSEYSERKITVSVDKGLRQVDLQEVCRLADQKLFLLLTNKDQQTDSRQQIEQHTNLADKTLVETPRALQLCFFSSLAWVNLLGKWAWKDLWRNSHEYNCNFDPPAKTD
jgi:hypothetical protein